MNGPVFVDMPDMPGGDDPKIAKLIEAAESRIEFASERLDPASSQADATIALAQIALATFLRGDR